jgi:Uma2 family endonuclease
MATQTLMTAEQFDQLPEEEGRRWELLDGELVEMPNASLKHNLITSLLSHRWFTYFETHKIGVAAQETDFSFGSERRLRPDLAMISLEALAGLDIERVPVTAVPLIVVEVVSPSQNFDQLHRKIQIYLESGVEEVWVVYPGGKQIYVHRKGTVQLYSAEESIATPFLPGWSLRVGDLFTLA